MSPLVEFIITSIIKYAPVLAIEIIQILSKPDYSDADWEALKAKYRGKTYDDYVK